MKNIIQLSLLLLMATTSVAQQKIKGIAIDTLKQLSMQSATVTLLDKADSSIICFTRTNPEGAFTLNVKDPGMYLLLIGFKNYVDYYDNINVAKNEEKNTYAVERSIVKRNCSYSSAGSHKNKRRHNGVCSR